MFVFSTRRKNGKNAVHSLWISCGKEKRFDYPINLFLEGGVLYEEGPDLITSV